MMSSDLKDVVSLSLSLSLSSRVSDGQLTIILLVKLEVNFNQNFLL